MNTFYSSVLSRVRARKDARTFHFKCEKCTECTHREHIPNRCTAFCANNQILGTLRRRDFVLRGLYSTLAETSLKSFQSSSEEGRG